MSNHDAYAASLGMKLFRFAATSVLLVACVDHEAGFADKVHDNQSSDGKADGTCNTGSCSQLCTRRLQSQIPCHPLRPLERAIVDELTTVFFEQPRYVCGYFASENLRSACGPALVDNAWVCTIDEGLGYDIKLIDDRVARFGDFGAVAIVAHEYGHLLQLRAHVLQNPQRTAKQNELQADCLAGVFTGIQEQRGHLDAGDIQEGINVMCNGGDPQILPPEQAHGICPERIASFQRGLDGARVAFAGVCDGNPLDTSFAICAN